MKVSDLLNLLTSDNAIIRIYAADGPETPVAEADAFTVCREYGDCIIDCISPSYAGMSIYIQSK